MTVSSFLILNRLYRDTAARSLMADRQLARAALANGIRARGNGFEWSVGK